MTNKKVEDIVRAFVGVKIPKDKRKHFKAEISTLRAQQAKHGYLQNNNQVYASIGNLRKLLKECRKES